MLIATIFSSNFIASSYNFFSLSSGAYVFVKDWKYTMYFEFGHFFKILFFISSNCFLRESNLFPANSPLPFSLQYIQPLSLIVPSLFGQVNPPSRLTLNTFEEY
jgi:hypothetical protein